MPNTQQDWLENISRESLLLFLLQIVFILIMMQLNSGFTAKKGWTSYSFGRDTLKYKTFLQVTQSNYLCIQSWTIPAEEIKNYNLVTRPSLLVRSANSTSWSQSGTVSIWTYVSTKSPSSIFQFQEHRILKIEKNSPNFNIFNQLWTRVISSKAYQL